jgi:hypothetical protein
MRIAEQAAIGIAWAVTMAVGGTLLAVVPEPQWPAGPRGMRPLVFAVVMTCVYLIGYQAYRHQTDGGGWSSSSGRRAYWPALKLAALEQCIVGILAALVLDCGQCMHVTLVSVAAYWPSVCIVVARRPTSPTSGDIAFVKLGFLLILMVVMIAGTAYWTWRGRW